MAHLRAKVFAAGLLFTFVSSISAQDQMSNVLRGRARNMLRETVKAIEKNYYDPKLNGADLNAREKEAEAKIDLAPNLSAALGVIAWTVDGLNDSHTAFIPPLRPYRIEEDWRVGAIGERCFISAVRPGSDAAAQGLKPGDELLAMDGFRVNRATLGKVQYAFEVLAPRAAHDLIVAAPGQQPRKMTIKVKYIKLLKLYENYNDWMEIIRKSQLDEEASHGRWAELGEDVFVYNLPIFGLSDGQVDDMFKKAEKHKTLILDLRGDPGGDEEVLLRMLGHLFDHDVKVFDRLTRKGEDPVLAKAQKHQFRGKLIVLIDGSSASCSELFARIVQLEKRGVVIGDRSAGKVMESRYFSMQEGPERVAMYAVQITVGNAIMADGKSLEKNPVVPDELMIPSPEDLSAGRDPVLAHAITEAGGKMTAKDAGRLFPAVWARL